MKILATVVVRSALKGDSHGSVHLLDLANGKSAQVIDWSHQDINWAGRGYDRGLRGIAFWRNQTLIAATDEIIFLNQAFDIVKRVSNRYLRHCHEICVIGNHLYATSTGFDSLLRLDLENQEFVDGYHLRIDWQGKVRSKFGGASTPSLIKFDPNAINGPIPGDRLHINNVCEHKGKLYISGTRLNRLFELDAEQVIPRCNIPTMTHNVQFFDDGFIYNDSERDRVVVDRISKKNSYFQVPTYPVTELKNHQLPHDYARQGFARGLCVLPNKKIVGGSSPSTITVYDSHDGHTQSQTFNISMDVRHAIHGLEYYPYA